jgi:hypothetical protein
MQESMISAAKALDDDFLQRMNRGFERLDGRIHLYEKKIRKHSMLAEGIET